MLSILFLVLFITVSCIELPLYFPRCYSNDSQISDCLLKAANDLRPNILNGIKEIKFPSLNPYILPNFFVNHTKGDVHFKGYIRSLTFFGFDKYEISELQFYPKDVMLRGKLHFEYLPSSSLYVVEGKKSILPLSGDGSFAQILQNVNISFILVGDLISKNDVQYCKLTNVNIRLNIERIYIQFSGLKHEEGLWGKTNELLIIHSDLVAAELTPVYEEIFKKYVTEYLEWFLNEFPFSVLFPNAS